MRLFISRKSAVLLISHSWCVAYAPPVCYVLVHVAYSPIFQLCSRPKYSIDLM